MGPRRGLRPWPRDGDVLCFASLVATGVPKKKKTIKDYFIEFWAECINGGDNAAQGGPDGCVFCSRVFS